MLINKEKIQHINSIAHEGKVVVVATDADGKIWYTVKQDGFEDSYLSQSPEQRTGWEAWEELQLPNEPDDQSVLDKEKKELTDQNDGRIYFLRSLYKTHDQSAVAPVQLVSGLGYIYIFRQSKTNTLLVDRFVLDGLTNKLVRKLEVRFKRSKQKHTPSKNQKKGSSGLANIDSLDFTDILGNNFYEPTTELSLIDNLRDGWFSVVLLPTDEQDKYRWHIFAYNSRAAKVEITTLRASEEGLFDIKDYTVLDPEPRRIDGIIKRSLNLGSRTVTKGLAAVKYDVQRERQTDDGMQLLRESVRVMLAVGTGEGNVAAISFAAAADGTLSQIADAPSEPKKFRRSTTRQILLPLNTLDEIKAIGTASPPPKGTITGFVRGEEDEVILTSKEATGISATEITQVKVTGNQAYNRLYSQVAKIDDDTFEITPESADGGNWEVVPEEETGLIFNGIVTAYEITSRGKLKVTALNHGLENGDEVQVVDTKDYNGTYTVTKIDAKTFSLDGVRWQAGTAINLQTQKRRGVTFDGADDYIDLPDMNHDFSQGFTIEAWVWYDGFHHWSRIIDFGNGANVDNIVFANEGTSNKLQLLICKGNNGQFCGAAGVLETGKWMHLAVTLDASGTGKLYKNGNQIGTGTIHLPNSVNRTQNYIGKSNWETDSYFKGKLSDLRLWNIARTADDIKNSMHLQLSGKEVGLAGYWRLDSILEGPERKVIDFSVNGNNGVVKGGAYVSSVTLPRNLDKKNTKAIKYENDELFAVSERATYTEEFEFRTDGTGDPKTAPIFAITYKGKKNRSSETWIPIAAGSNPTEITGPVDGWYKASSRFTVPDGVSVVRSFGIGDVAGAWNALDIRKHQIHLVSDTVTEAKYTDDVTAIRPLTDNQLSLQEDLKKLGIAESKEGTLLKEKRKLEAEIASLSLTGAAREAALNAKRAEVAAQQRIVDEATRTLNYWRLEKERASKMVQLFEHSDYNGESQLFTIGYYNLRRFSEGKWCDRFSSVRVPDGLKVSLFFHDNFTGTVLGLTADSRYIGDELNDDVASIKVETVEWHHEESEIRDQFAKSENIFRQEDAILTRLKNELADLNAAAATREAKLRILQERLRIVNQELTPIQRALNDANNNLIGAVKRNQQTAQTMPSLKTDNRGLATQGALLEFVRPASRLTALETCEGNVQLSYFDDQGRMRQTNFDATSDSKNPTSEQWIPDSVRTCLNFERTSDVVTLENPVSLGDEWTIEAWFVYPLAKTDEWNTLTRGKDKDHQIVVKRDTTAERLGMRLSDGNRFVDSGYDMKNLSAGWYHLAAVSEGNDKEAKTTFYIDGKKVGEAPAKSITDVHAIGNAQAGGQQFGKLAEVRIWGIPLSSDEIAVNSKTLLTGNEPGLLAYFPFNEATGTAVRNQTGASRNNGAIAGASWWGCAAPIGSLGHQVIQFDGENDHVSFAALNTDFSQGFTLEAWVWYDSFKNWSRIIDFGNGAGADNILFANIDSTNNLRFDVYRGAVTQGITVTGILETGKWMHLAAAIDASGNAKIYKNGSQIGTGQVNLPNSLNRTKNYIGKSNWGGNDGYFHGKMSEVRIWNKGRTQAEIQAGMHKRMTGKEPGLVLYCPLNSMVGGQDFTVSHAITVPDAVLPIGGDALVSSEYFTVGKDRSAMMRRFFAAPAFQGVNLLPDKRVEQLELKWIGNGQFAPTLLGYIEGAPPIPSENLTFEEGYNGATSVELTVSEDVEYKWTRTQESGLGGTIETFIGGDAEAEAGVGLLTRIANVRAGFKGNLDFNYQFQNESSITSSSSLNMTDKLQLYGTQEQNANFPHLGKRFIPKNIGYALVVSALADVFITRLKRTGKMIGYQVLPVDNIPPDINTITFLINPAYTMSGSLDGMTGSSATSKRFFKHVPEMRAQFGSLYPASYYRLQEAYDLKQQIEQHDKDRESYFAQFDSLLVDETSLNRETDKGDAPEGVGVIREEDKPAKELTEEEQKAADKEKQESLTRETKVAQDKQSEAVEKKQAEIEKKIEDENDKSHAAASFAGWQKKMEDIQIRAGKRNIVNTYVWDADGGLRSEAQSFASTAEHSIGGSFSFNAALGFEGKFKSSAFAAELTAQATINLTQTMSKTQTRSKGIQLNVDLSGVESRGITDYNDYPILPGEKVNRYRFMSFYLEGSTNNFTDFFSYVVDPEWLASNSEEARALRQAKGKANKAWRVLHRVTYVERPALMGFGRDVRRLPAAETATDLGQLKAKVDEMHRKLDEILKKLP